MTSQKREDNNNKSNERDHPLSLIEGEVEGEVRNRPVDGGRIVGGVGRGGGQDLEDGDISNGYLSFDSLSTTNQTTTTTTTTTNLPLQLNDSIEIPTIETSISSAALPIPSTSSSIARPTSLVPTRTRTISIISNSDRRNLSTSTGLTSPKLLPGSPRTRFDLSGQTMLNQPSPGNLNLGIPLKPILNIPRMEEMDLGEAALLPDGYQQHGESRREGEDDELIDDEMDLAPLEEIIDVHRRFEENGLGGELIPERTVHNLIRTPHPLYTPIINPRIARRRRRRAMSIHSTKTEKITFSSITKNQLKSAWNLLRLKKYLKHGGRSDKSNATSSTHTGSSSGSSSNSSSGSSSSSSSRRSNSTWGGWKFWKNDSDTDSSSNDHDRDGNDSDDDEFEPPTPHFTLLTPTLGRLVNNTGSRTPGGARTPGGTATTNLNYPDHLLPSNSIDKSLPSTSASTSTSPTPSSSSPRDSTQPPPPSTSTTNKIKPFELSTTSTLTPALERLQSFWLEKRQVDSLAGDLGAGSGGGTGTGFNSYPTSPIEGDEPLLSSSIGALPAAGLAGGGRKLRGEEKAAKAEKLRLGNSMEEGPAWWLDVMCPTVNDMREIRKVLPLHPLTMEDILQQETREKMETFPSLGYYFVVFRALDESYFRYTSPPEVTESGTDGKVKRKDSDRTGKTSKGRVDIVEGVGGKEGVEGVSVGAVNLYLVVFPDGIISFHFEDISKHVEKVQGRIHQLSVSRTMSSHWIAYSLMDSIVDAFFPLIDYVEGESNDVDSFLADPLNSATAGRKPIQPEQVSSSTSKAYDEKITAISVISTSGSNEKVNSNNASDTTVFGGNLTDDIGKLPAITSTQTTVTRRFKAAVVKGFPRLVVPSILLRVIPSSWTESTMKSYDTTSQVIVQPLESEGPSTLDDKAISSRQRRQKYTKFDRAAMLKRITDARKLVTGLSRILGPKLDVVKGLRKRMKLEHDRMFRSGDNQDIEIYIGDLSDHIAAMHQSLVFYEAILAHDHPAYLGILRLSLHDAKGGTDIGILQLYVVTLTIIPMNIVIGMFSLNVAAPVNGSRGDHLEEDGSIAGFQLFGIVISGIFLVGVLMTLLMRFMIKSAKRQHVRKGPPILRIRPVEIDTRA